MRMINLVAANLRITTAIKSGRRKFLRFDLNSAPAKRVHIGDIVRIYTYNADFPPVVRKVCNKQKIMAVKPGETDPSPVICLWFE